MEYANHAKAGIRKKYTLTNVCVPEGATNADRSCDTHLGKPDSFISSFFTRHENCFVKSKFPDISLHFTVFSLQYRSVDTN